MRNKIRLKIFKRILKIGQKTTIIIEFYGQLISEKNQFFFTLGVFNCEKRHNAVISHSAFEEKRQEDNTSIPTPLLFGIPNESGVGILYLLMIDIK